MGVGSCQFCKEYYESTNEINTGNLEILNSQSSTFGRFKNPFFPKGYELSDYINDTEKNFSNINNENKGEKEEEKEKECEEEEKKDDKEKEEEIERINRLILKKEILEKEKNDREKKGNENNIINIDLVNSLSNIINENNENNINKEIPISIQEEKKKMPK